MTCTCLIGVAIAQADSIRADRDALAAQLAEPQQHAAACLAHQMRLAMERDAARRERDSLRALAIEACEIAEKHITNDNSALTDDRLGEIQTEARPRTP